jgi:natural product precursor
MKTKKFNKKLGLNKTTIADLDVRQMKGLKGGGITETCPWVCEPTRKCSGGCPVTEGC